MGRGGIIIMQCSTNVVDLDTNKCVLLPSHDEESNHCCDDQDTIESKCNVGDGHSRRKKRRRKKRRRENQFTHNDGDRQSHNPPAWCHVLKLTRPTTPSHPKHYP